MWCFADEAVRSLPAGCVVPTPDVHDVQRSRVSGTRHVWEGKFAMA